MTQELKFGHRPPKDAPALQFKSFFSGTVPSAPASVDYGQRFKAWQMLGNDQYGDCVAVTWANQRALVTTVLGDATDYPTMDKVIEFYKTQNPNFPNDDNGMVIQTALEYLHSNGGPDGVKVVAFAKVDHTNEAELRAAHAIFGQVWYGVNVQNINMYQFNNNEPWDYAAGNPNDGGHSITGVGYDSNDYKFVTWAEETSWTEAFRQHQVEEAWVVIWPEHLKSKQFEEGVDLQTLAADYKALTGDTLQVPDQPPVTPPANLTVTYSSQEAWDRMQAFSQRHPSWHISQDWRQATGQA